MNILFIADKSIIGGATVALLNLIRELREKNEISITVVTVNHNELNEKLDNMGVANFPDYHVEAMQEISRGRLPVIVQLLRARLKLFVSHHESIKKIEKEINVSDFDIIHTNSTRTDIGCYLAKKYNIPHIMHVREFGTLDYGCKYVHKNYIKFLNESVDLFIAVSDAVKEYWISIGLDKAKIRTIYDGVDVALFDGDKTTYEDETLNLISIGSIRPSKGQYQIIEALGMLPENIRQKVKLSLYGWSTEKYIEELKELAQKYCVEKQVHFGGAINNASEILGRFDVGITASKSEGFGLVTNEYMLSRLGVIVTNTGASPELIENEKTGLIYEYGNIKDLASKIKRFYENRDFLEKCADNARAQALEKFTSKKNADNTLEIYMFLVENKRNFEL